MLASKTFFLVLPYFFPNNHDKEKWKTRSKSEFMISPCSYDHPEYSVRTGMFRKGLYVSFYKSIIESQKGYSKTLLKALSLCCFSAMV